MRISNMAAKNIKGNLYRYIMYYLSNVFAVGVFFIFANFVFHPALNSGSISPSQGANEGVANGIVACQVIIVIFSVLFVSYSTSIFLKSRGKEFGLLSLFGMTKGQIKKYVLIEATIISILSIGTGILTGTIFSKLFFMAMEAFMDIKLPFNLSLKALGLTTGVFLALFEVINIIMLFQIRNKQIIQQLKTDKTPKVVPKFSIAKSILGVGLVVSGYVIAWLVSGAYVVLAMIPVILIVVAGTYFIFTQFSIAVANMVRKNKRIFYSKTNMVAFSQMIFKLQDTAKVLFLAAILGAITFSATETIYSFFTEIPIISGIDTPQDMVLIQKGETLDDTESIAQVREILQKHNLKISEFSIVKNVNVLNETKKNSEGNSTEILTMSNSDYNKLAKSIGKNQITVKQNEVVYNFPYEIMDFNGNIENTKKFPFEAVKLNLNGEIKEFKVREEVHGGVMALYKVGYFDVLIMNDSDFLNLLNKAKDNDIVIYNGVNINKWQKAFNASLEIQDMLGSKYEGSYYSKAIPFKEIRRSFGMTLFIGFFIAFLFFIASGSIIYFKLFNEIKQDGVEYNILKKIGVTKKEINKMITKQIAIIFFLPFVVSTIHSLFALKSLSNLLMKNLFANGIVVMMGYFVFQAIYFLIIRRIYINRIKCLTID
ncbi:FtsX-like permease family protein [Brassicibacter mesophilus]|uniref:ABC transporter permease n=1 Tax=Brassicibacter mesophilus TaxID=745119 RepID=UPI003D1E14BE